MKSNIPTLSADELSAWFSGSKVDVYFNLHKKLWSVRSVVTGRVIAHTYGVNLVNVIPRVSEAGRQRVIREQRKNVHAFLRGMISEDSNTRTGGDSVTYNPYQSARFHRRSDGAAVVSAKRAELYGRRVSLFETLVD